jgi:hypothetical protein
MNRINELNMVALLKGIPEHNLSKGQVGTVVEKLNEKTYEIEFTNSKGETLITTPVASKDLILLHFELA